MEGVVLGRAAVDWGEQRICRRFMPARVQSSVVSVLRQGRCVYRHAAGLRADPVHTGLSGFDVRRTIAERGNTAAAVPVGRRLDDGSGLGLARIAMVAATVQLRCSPGVSEWLGNGEPSDVDRYKLDHAGLHGAGAESFYARLGDDLQ